ncbi:VOC family protein [Parasegetibacter sp. NRK P23]|uniref:SMU1112c/YaeR family gloxylase I-like metalloprotein n=1 Tax=Parasegetibacter sp. NRK P23 TaxID=2942999 RepID=UPI002043B5EF|nr:VOC family protein [Parasegetibacter sp. NRK P23]MCM5528441.1 VOC family protein [Parasegetibacter sp. NRK P23]
MKLLGIHHVAILTDDYEKSKKFYTEVLGFQVMAETYRENRNSWKLDLALDGGYMIELFSFPDFRERASFPEAKGLRHLAFSVADVEQARTFLLDKGVEKVEEIRIDELTGKTFLFFYDPNGQPLELYET